MGQITIAQMRASVRKPIGIEEGDPDLTTTDIDLYLNRSFWEVQDKFKFREKERTGTFVTQIGVRNYEMPTPFEALQGLAVVDDVSGQHTPLDPTTADYYEQVYIEGELEYGKPQKYLREDCFARIWPTPDKAYTMVIRRWITLTDLSDVQTTSQLPRVWDEIVIYGAVWRIFIDLGDFTRANQMKGHQVSLINTIEEVPAEELGDTHRAGLEVLGREY